MSKISIIGAGNVGATAAMKIASMGIVNKVVLLDVKEGIAEGKAMDIMQCGVCQDFNTEVVGVTNDYTATANSEIIVITSGVPRKPGMTREELVGINSSIMKSVVTECDKNSPHAIYIVVSNPMDTMTYQVISILYRLHPDMPLEMLGRKVFGMGGMLDSSRFRYFIKQAIDAKKPDYKCTMSDIYAWVIGGHGDTTMIPLWQDAVVVDPEMGTIPLTSILSQEEIDEVVQKTMKGGATLTGLLGTSAWEAPGAAIADTVKNVIKNEERIMPCSVFRPEYDCCIGTLVRLGRIGVTSRYVKTDEAVDKNELYDKFKASIEAVKKVNNELPKID